MDHKKVVTILVKSGANVNYRSDIYNTALYHSVSQGLRYFTKLFLDHGANVNELHSIITFFDSSTVNNRTLFIFPMQKCDEEMAKLLINEGINVNHVDDNGQSNLHLAASNFDFNTIKLLLSNGAKVDLRDNNENDPMSSLLMNNVKHINLLADMYNPKNLSHLMCTIDNIGTVKVFTVSNIIIC